MAKDSSDKQLNNKGNKRGLHRHPNSRKNLENGYLWSLFDRIKRGCPNSDTASRLAHSELPPSLLKSSTGC